MSKFILPFGCAPLIEMPYLAFNLNDGNEFVFDLIEDRLRLGRSPDNDIVIDNSYISGHHAELLKQPDGSYELVDLESSNGTLVNSKRIDRVRLKGGDRLRFGQLAARYRERPPRGLAPSEPAARTGGSALEPGRTNGKPGAPKSAISPVEAAAPRKETERQEPATLGGVKMTGSEVTAFARVERLRREQAELEEKRETSLRELEKAQADLAQARQELARVQSEAAQKSTGIPKEQEVQPAKSGLAPDEETAVQFAQDIIKRLDLVDSLKQRYAGTEVASQLDTLCASLEDILKQHRISELHVEPGTPLDMALRRRIIVVESKPDAGPVRVLETRRSGFARANEDGSERVLRKVEVITTSAI